MITLSIILTLYCVLGWIYRYYKSRKDEDYDINPFREDADIGSFSLILTTLILFGIGIGLIIKYLP